MASARIFVGAAAVALIALASLPLWTGASLSLGDNRSMYVSLPSYWHDAAAYVNADPSSGPALILPPNDFYKRSYAWGYGGVDIIPASVFTRPTLIPGPSLDYLDDPRNMSLTSVMAAYAKEDPPRLLAAARNLGITFIICRNDVTSSQRDCGLNEKAQGLQIRRFGDLLVARLSNQQPAFPAWNGWVDGTYDGLTPGNLLGLGIITKPLPRFNADPRVATAAPHDLVSVESSRTQVINTMIAFVASGSSAPARQILAKVPFSVAATFSSSLTPLASLDGFVPRGHVVLSGLIQPAFTAIDARHMALYFESIIQALRRSRPALSLHPNQGLISLQKHCR